MKQLVGLAIVFLVTLGCQDLRDASGTWSGPRVGDRVLHVGFAVDARAELTIAEAGRRRLSGRLTTSDGVFDDALVEPLPASQADVLDSLSFGGDPSAVFFCLVQAADGGGPATVLVSIYNDERIEVRAIRGGDAPLYGIFALALY